MHIRCALGLPSAYYLISLRLSGLTEGQAVLVRSTDDTHARSEDMVADVGRAWC
jgi:uncharacterized UPF0160 family protein